MNTDLSKDSFRKLFMKMVNTNHYSPHEMWSDMICVFACMISNTVDKHNFDDREKLLNDTLNKYDDGTKKDFTELFVHLVNVFEGNVIVNNGVVEKIKFDDVLGDLYMHLDFGNDRGGQFFTPYNVASLVGNIAFTDSIEKQLDSKEEVITINDPACGGGALLIAGAEMLFNKGINYQADAFFVGNDIDFTTALMCYIQLSLIGAKGCVHVGDSLRDPTIDNLGSNTWWTPMAKDSMEVNRWNQLFRMRY